MLVAVCIVVVCGLSPAILSAAGVAAWQRSSPHTANLCLSYQAELQKRYRLACQIHSQVSRKGEFLNTSICTRCDGVDVSILTYCNPGWGGVSTRYGVPVVPHCQEVTGASKHFDSLIGVVYHVDVILVIHRDTNRLSSPARALPCQDAQPGSLTSPVSNGAGLLFVCRHHQTQHIRPNIQWTIAPPTISTASAHDEVVATHLQVLESVMASGATVAVYHYAAATHLRSAPVGSADTS